MKISLAKRATLIFSGLVISQVGFGEEEASCPLRAESLPVDQIKCANDTYFEGYIQALLDVHYYEFKVVVVSRDHCIYLYNLPKNQMLKNSIISFVSDLPGVKSVQVGDGIPQDVKEERREYIPKQQVHGVWFPQSTVLFQPMLADPREPCYSGAYRWGDEVLGNKAVAVSFGDDFPIFRWFNVWRWHGDLQIGIQAGVWSIFKMGHQGDEGEFSELVTTDYLVGIPLSYAFDRWSFRARLYHISSHLGDEFMCNHKKVRRKNPSMEAIDIFAAYQINRAIRIYIGPGVVLHSDDSFKLKPLYIEGGGEARFWGRKFYYHRLYGTPFIAFFLRSWQAVSWTLDGFYELGYEWSKLQGVGRKLRIFGEYHHGYSEGQFFKKHTSWVSIALSYGF